LLLTLTLTLTQKGIHSLASHHQVLPGSDWAVLALGLPGTASAVEIDTHFYRGNYPESCMVSPLPLVMPCSPYLHDDGDDFGGAQVEGCYIPSSQGGEDQALAWQAADWKVLLPRTRVGPNVPHHYSVDAGTLHQVR
jgi:allantoicase